ncbi:MAG: AraC family transcriptional regulator [Xanthomonadales bacterium]|nr:AraC family transcriptional regulator [Xanthomonadales bacterium]
MQLPTSDRVSIHRHDSVLGQWTVALCQPPPQLQGIVAQLWYGEGQVSYARDRILPSGQSQLLINLGPVQYRVRPGPPEQRIAFRDIWYAGLHQGPIDTEAPHGSALLGVAFSAHGGFPWLQADQSQHCDHIIALADALGDGVLALRQRLLDNADIVRRFELVESWLQARLDPRAAVHPAVRWSVERIASRGGQIGVVELASQTGYTRKHLNALFQRQVGMGPKALARVHRFNAAIARLQGLDEVPWASLAQLCGYYDQSHLVRDFRSFSGYAPAEFLRHGRPDGSSVVVQ